MWQKPLTIKKVYFTKLTTLKYYFLTTIYRFQVYVPTKVHDGCCNDGCGNLDHDETNKQDVSLDVEQDWIADKTSTS